MLNTKAIRVTVLTTLTLIIIIPVLLSIKISYLPDRLQPGLGATERIYKDVTLTQGFESKKNNLSGIGLSIKNPYFRNKNDLILSIKDTNGSLLRTMSINGANIEDGSFLILKFDSLNNSKNKNYSFELSAPGSENSDSLEVFYTKNLPAGDTPLELNGKDNDMSLAYVAYYKQQNLFLSWIDIYTSVILRMFKDTGFFIFYLLLVIGLVFILSKNYSKKI